MEAGAIGTAIALATGKKISVAEGAAALADLVEFLARGQIAAKMLARDLAEAQAAGLPDITDEHVNAARGYAIARSDALEAKLDAAEANQQVGTNTNVSTQ